VGSSRQARSGEATDAASAPDVTSKPTRRVQVARLTVRQDSKLLQLPVEILQEVRAAYGSRVLPLTSTPRFYHELILLTSSTGRTAVESAFDQGSGDSAVTDELSCSLNDWLTSKRSQQIWNIARSNTKLYNKDYWSSEKEALELPTCPETMTPFSHARLLFDNECVVGPSSLVCYFTTTKPVSDLRAGQPLRGMHSYLVWFEQNLRKMQEQYASYKTAPQGHVGK
jgi:hypothetical protein